MAKIKLGISDEEFERQFAEAEQRGKERLKTEPRAKSSRYDPTARRVIIELLNGCTLFVPVDLMQGLHGAADEDLADFTLMPRGFDLHWHKLDAQFTVVGLLNGLFGTKKWMAELNNARTGAETKRASSRSIGKLKQHPRSATADQANKRRRSAKESP
jgi:hypothetical protein